MGEEPALKREIGLIGAAFIALNGVVGAGIFAAPADLVAGAGGFSPYLFLIFGALMISVAAVLAILAARSDATGGPVAYATSAFGPFAGFQAGWLFFLARIAAFAANANAFLTYLAVFAPGVDQGVARALTIVALIVIFTGLNIAGVKQAVRTLNVITIVKLTPLLVFIVWGLSANADAIPAPSTPPSLEAIGGISLLLLYAFVGFEIATLTAGETRDAKRALPRALIGTLVSMALLYFFVQLAYVATMRGAAPDGAPLAAAAALLAGPWGAGAIAAAALISIGGNLFAQMITSPRIPFALAQNGSLPAWFGGVHPRFATPVNSILFLAAVSGVMAVSGAFVWLAIMSALARLVVYLICVAAVPKLKGGPRVRMWEWAATAVAAVLCVWAASQALASSWAVMIGFAFAGAVLYALNRWRNRPAQPI
ncbi:MAG: APC family permease [Hyphomonadaceae bacterium]